MATNPVLTFALTPEQWLEAKAELAEQTGVHLAGDAGSASHEGVTIAFDFDGTAKLTLQVTDRKFYDPSVQAIDEKLTAAIQAITHGG